MRTFTNIEEAREAADKMPAVKEIIEIDHVTEGLCYINITGYIQDLRTMLSNTPNSEIKALIAAHHTNATIAHNTMIEQIAAIPGMSELKKASSIVSYARDDYNQACKYGYPVREAKSMELAEKKYKELADEYPIASAYLSAEAWVIYSHWSNTEKVAAGRKACQRILSGDNWQDVLSDMDAEWTSYATAASARA